MMGLLLAKQQKIRSYFPHIYGETFLHLNILEYAVALDRWNLF